MEDEITDRNFHLLQNLYIVYKKKSNEFTPLEFLRNILAKTEDSPPDIILQMFLNLMKHEQIFLCLMEEYVAKYTTRYFKVSSGDKTLLKLLFFLIILELNESNWNELRYIIGKSKRTKMEKFLEFMNCEDFLILTTEITCTIFSSDYTLEKVIRPLVKKIDLITKLHRSVTTHFLKRSEKQLGLKPPTVPKSPNLSKPKPKPLPPEPPKPITITRTPIPSTTYRQDNTIVKRLIQERKKNQNKALKLLEMAKNNASNYAKSVVRKEVPEEKRKMIKANKAPKFKPVQVKPTAAVVMRAAHQMTKNCEEEVKKIEYMINNAADPSIFENWEEEERRKLEIEHLQNIQKKHLMGLLTREEAVLAKQNLLKLNKERMVEIKEEKAQLSLKLEEWREKERKRVQEIVEREQQTQELVKEAERKMFEEKKQAARQIDEQNKALLRQAMEEKEAEMARKIEIIKDLKALESLKDLNKKEFDPTEAPNLGLLCEMSIAELQERLMCLKLEVEEDMKKKKKTVSDTRNQRKEMVKNAEEFIEANKEYLKIKKEKPKKITKAKDTPEIIALRNKIIKAKQMKMLNAIDLQYNF